MEPDLLGYSKEVASIDLIKMYEPKENPYYVAFSGGKDSIVVADLVKRSGVRAEYFYHLTTVDPPELVSYIKKIHPYVKFTAPKKSMWRLIESKRMPPTRLVRYCCTALKEGGGIGLTTITGIRWAESFKRSLRKPFEVKRRKATSLIPNPSYLVNPIINWSDEDIWGYIKSNNLPYCSLYDEGYKRLGCIGCPMAGRKVQEREFQRWPKYREAYLRAFDAMLAKNRAEGYVSKLNWKNANDVMAWWLGQSDEQEPGQTCFSFDNAHGGLG